MFASISNQVEDGQAVAPGELEWFLIQRGDCVIEELHVIINTGATVATSASVITVHQAAIDKRSSDTKYK